MSEEPTLPSEFKVYPNDIKTTKKIETTVKPISFASVYEISNSSQLIYLHSLRGKLDVILPDTKTNEYLSQFRQYAFYADVSSGKLKTIKRALMLPGPKSSMWTLLYLDGLKQSNLTRLRRPKISSRVPNLQICNRKNTLASESIIFKGTMDEIKEQEAIPSYIMDFSMAVPGTHKKPQPHVSVDDSLTKVDPQEYLGYRYFMMLYKEAIPTQFFTKSTISRVYVLAHFDNELVRQSLSKYMIKTIRDFDKRYSFTHLNDEDDQEFRSAGFSDRWLDEDIMLDKSESSFRKQYLDKLLGSSGTLDNASVASKLTKLKIRDAKLQILLDLETLYLLNIEQSETSSSSPIPSDITTIKRKTRKHRSLVRRRLVGHKKRMLPTFIGMAIPVDTHFTTDLRHISSTKPERLDSAAVEQLIRGWFDRLCVWDAILGVPETDDNSSFSFLKTSVLPFYSKKHHKLLKELVSRSRGVPLDKHRHHHSHHRHNSHKQPSDSSSQYESMPPLGSSKSMREFSSRPSLRRASSSLAGLKDLQPRKMASSYVSHEDFSKKTFEMVRTTSFSQLFAHKSMKESTIQVHHESSIFDHSRKRKLVAPRQRRKRVRKAEVTEIKATPQKRRRHYKVSKETIAKTSPLKPVNEETQEITSSVVKATPSKQGSEMKRNGTMVIIDSSPAVKVSPLKQKTPGLKPSAMSIESLMETSSAKIDGDTDDGLDTLFSSPITSPKKSPTPKHHHTRRKLKFD